LGALPKNAFDMELPEMDLFYLEEIEQLRIGLMTLGNFGAGGPEEVRLKEAWQALQKAAKGWGWDIDDFKSSSGDQAGDAVTSDDEEEEEGEYAPQVVDI
jgi:A1 cistron-splicing factor AAR2